MKQKLYLIAIDLDGTLVEHFDEYDQTSFDYLQSIKESYHIVIATGRPYRSSKPYYDMLGLDTPIVNYNGALVHHPNDPKFKKFMITIPKDWVIQLILDQSSILSNVFCEVEDDIFLWKEDSSIESYLHVAGGNLHIGDFQDILKDDPNGAIVFSKQGSEEVLEEYIQEKYQGELKIRFWSSNEYVVSEVYNPLTSKANGLQIILDYYQLTKDQLIAIGDGHNDIEMLMLADVGVAMENAHRDLQKIATHHTGSVQNSGVYTFLKSFLNQKTKDV